MKEYLAELVRKTDPTQARNVVREYLQARILESLQRSGAMMPLAFHGGTALRFLYHIPRYSEDLDFGLERTPARYDLRGYLSAIRTALVTETYNVNIKVNDRRIVHRARVSFPGLLYELGISPHPDQVLAVKIEVDTRPPAGAVLATTMVRRYIVLQVQHHDRASLLAGKLHAILQRPYAKGRDLYDLLWYLSDPGWPAPNLALLNNALRQTGWTGQELSVDSWRTAVRQRVQELSWDRVVSDVRPFIKAGELALLTRENLLRVLG